MAVKKILLLGNPVLRVKCSPVKNIPSAETRRTIRDLHDTLNDFRKRHGFGRGIAAPQIGSTVRIIFIRMNSIGPLINPRIIERSKKRVELWDDCFSFPDILVRVRRHSQIHVSYQDKAGRKQTLVAEGGLSELLQHEIDHINGILAVDRALSSKHIVLRSEIAMLP